MKKSLPIILTVALISVPVYNIKEKGIQGFLDSFKIPQSYLESSNQENDTTDNYNIISKLGLSGYIPTQKDMELFLDGEINRNNQLELYLQKEWENYK